MVKLQRGNKVITVEPHSWSLNEDGKTRAEVSQLPLRLAWAITIHKSQGMTLTSVNMDLKGADRSPGLAYVALSRCSSLEGIFMRSISRMEIQRCANAHPDVLRFHKEYILKET